MLKIALGGQTHIWAWDGGEKRYRPVDEAYLARVLPGFRDLNERARARRKARCLRENDVAKGGKIPAALPNTRPFRGADGKRRTPTPEELRRGAEALLALGELACEAETGWELLGCLLAGLWCRQLRRAEPGFRPVVAVAGSGGEAERICKALVKGAVTRRRWCHGNIRIKRRAVLDYRVKPGELPRHIQDFSRAKVKLRGYKTLRLPMPYRNTVALVIGAGSRQLRQAESCLEHAGVILLGCESCDWAGRTPTLRLTAYDPQVLAGLTGNRALTAAVLAGWWAECTRARAGAIVQAARASFGEKDSRYTEVVLEPRRLGREIRCQTLLAFLDLLETSGVMAAEELAQYRGAIREVYHPQPRPAGPIRRAEDPEVFVELMRGLMANGPVAGVGEPFRKADRLLGAWRDISGVRYLVLPEAGWAKAYRKAAGARGDLDLTVFQNQRWVALMQKGLAQAGVIKAPSAGYRYRYDLYGVGKRESTYVIAVPRERLTPP